MRFQGRHIDPISVWAEYVEFPANFDTSDDSEFTPLVVCPNPDHHTEKKHFQINLQKPLVHCFAGCGISGTYEHAIGMIEGIKPRESRKRILKHSRVGSITKKRKRTVETISPIDVSYESYIPPVGLEYLQSRGISSASITKWELGWDRDELRIVIPVKDARNRTRLLIRRAPNEKDQPKYLYTEGVERNRLLYGTCQIDLGMVRSFGIILVEGSIDTWVMHQQGFPCTVGILGSKLSEFQAKLILNMRPKRVYTMFDADGAGISATNSAIYGLSRVPIHVVRYPKGYTDPGSLVGMSSDRVARMIRRAVSKSEFHRLTRSHQTRSMTKRRERNQVG
jgi:DNA primase